MRAQRYALLFCLIFTWFAQSAHAQTGAENYPNRPVRFIVPYTPGSSLDVLARDLGQFFLEKLGQPMEIGRAHV